MSHCLQCGDYTRNGPYCRACEYLDPPESNEIVCVGCDQPFNESGWCEACETALTEQVAHELRFTIEMQRKVA